MELRRRFNGGRCPLQRLCRGSEIARHFFERDGATLVLFRWMTNQVARNWRSDKRTT